MREHNVFIKISLIRNNIINTEYVGEKYKRPPKHLHIGISYVCVITFPVRTQPVAKKRENLGLQQKQQSKSHLKQHIIRATAALTPHLSHDVLPASLRSQPFPLLPLETPLLAESPRSRAQDPLQDSPDSLLAVGTRRDLAHFSRGQVLPVPWGVELRHRKGFLLQAIDVALLQIHLIGV